MCAYNRDGKPELLPLAVLEAVIHPAQHNAASLVSDSRTTMETARCNSDECVLPSQALAPAWFLEEERVSKRRSAPELTYVPNVIVVPLCIRSYCRLSWAEQGSR